MEQFFSEFSTVHIILFAAAILAVCLFEFINGFHDTANAVATVIYTNTLPPAPAVIWSGVWNFLGVWAGGITVAASIVSLLPILELMDLPMAEILSLIFAILLSAILWNFITWYFGIPCSSSHALVGAILGGGLGFSVIHGHIGVNWSKAQEIGMSLLLSPAFGFSVVIVLIFFFRLVIKDQSIFKEPAKNTPPPGWIRAILIATCTLVSFFHGSNDGQKGVGILMIILLTLMPLRFALNPDMDKAEIKAALTSIETILGNHSENHLLQRELTARKETVALLARDLETLGETGGETPPAYRKRLQTLTRQVETLLKDPVIFSARAERKALRAEILTLKSYFQFAPVWAILLIASCLSLGTMIGWKRIVVTIGEKIGKTHLTYAQGAAAEIVAASTIGLSTGLGLPVSTTHVLSSGIAGSMVARKGLKNLQKDTVITIGLAWILTLPATIFGAMLLFFLFRLF